MLDIRPSLTQRTLPRTTGDEGFFREPHGVAYSSPMPAARDEMSRDLLTVESTLAL
jgi:hypothetical protein